MKYKKNIFSVFSVIVLAVALNSCSDDAVITPAYNSISPQASSHDGTYAIDWNLLLYKIIANESRYNPPKASRIYCYAGITLYESVVNGMPNNRSLAGQLNEMPYMPKPESGAEYDWPSVVAGAMPVVIKGLLQTNYNSSLTLINNLRDRQLAERYQLKDSAIVNRSIAYGEMVANKILAWSSTDRYAETRNMTYVPPPRSLNPANWEPINPGDTAEEPHWGTLRPFALPSAGYSEIPPSFPFDTLPTSPFYRDELEIKNIKQNLTQEQYDIAMYWRDKQLTGTPPGHWVHITCQMVSKFNLKLDRAAELFVLNGIAIGDAFIAAWCTKYKFNYLRPQSYIRDYIDPSFLPLIPTPPFPDYPSGHSTSSGCASYVLTQLLGTVSFTDTTHNRLGMPGRYFNSLEEAAVECSNSRVYGSIHYRNACENGVLMGRKIGTEIMSRVKLKIF